MRPLDDSEGRLIDGRYRILGRLGQGGMARVLLAEDETLHRRVAVKILEDRFAEDERFVERFRREAQAAAGLNHPNIVQIYDRGEADGHYYIVMEYLEGETLKDLVRRDGPLPPRRAIDLTLQVLAALRFAHRHGVVHRDVKPQNILLLRDGRVKVTDFGIARLGSSEMTEAGSIIGTAQYLSPEQARGLPVGPPADLYSTGCVLYELLTGRVPFDGDSAVSVAMKQIEEEPTPVRQLNANVPPDLERVVQRAMAKDVAQRYRTADEMGVDLDRVRKGLGVTQATAAMTAATAYASDVDLGSTRVQTAPVPPRRTDDRQRGGGGNRIWIVLLLLAVLLAIGAVVAYALRDDGGGGAASDPTTTTDATTTQATTTAPQLVRVPDVQGLQSAEASNLLDQQGFQVVVERSFSADVPQGQVISQDPEPRTEVEPRAIVTIVVSRGQRQFEVPDVEGEPFDQASAALVEAGFRVERVDEANPDVEAGIVIDQSVPAGERRPRGTSVTLRVSTGAPQVAVPNVIGVSDAEARSLILAAGLQVGEVAESADPDVPAGQVINADPAPGTEVASGSPVNLLVSSGPPPVAVPDVTGTAQAEAEASIQQAGLTADVTTQPVEDPAQDGIVLGQDPAAGREVESGSTVTITVGELLVQ